MSAMAYVSGTGECAKCHQPLLVAETTMDDGTGTGARVCLTCVGKKQGEGNVNDAPVPTEEELNRVLAKAGVKIPFVRPEPQAQTITKIVAPPQSTVVNVQPGQPFGILIGEALKIMRALPMPKDVKQFKAVNKIIASLEALQGV